MTTCHQKDRREAFWRKGSRFKQVTKRQLVRIMLPLAFCFQNHLPYFSLKVFEGIILVHYNHFLLALAHRVQLILTLNDFIVHNLLIIKLTENDIVFCCFWTMCTSLGNRVSSTSLTPAKEKQKVKVFSIHLCPLTAKKKLFQPSAFFKSTKSQP